MSANFAVSGSYDNVPPRFRSWYFAASTPGMSAIGERAVVIDGLPREALGVRRFQAGEIVDEMIERGRVDLHGTAIGGLPVPRNPAHHHGALVARGHAELQACGEVVQLLRHADFVAQEHDGPRHVRRSPAQCP